MMDLLIFFDCLGVSLFLEQQLIDVKLYGLLGERTAADDEKPSRKKKEKPTKSEVSSLSCFLNTCPFYVSDRL